MAKKRIVMALGHNALGTNLPEQKAAVAKTARVIADFIQDGWQVALVHSNAPQVGMIHTARAISDMIYRTAFGRSWCGEAFTSRYVPS